MSGTHLLSATMVLLWLTTLMPYIASTLDHKTVPTSINTILDGGITLTLLTKTLALNPRVLHSYLGSNIESLTTRLFNPSNQNLTESHKVLYLDPKPRLMKLLMSQSISWLWLSTES